MKSVLSFIHLSAKKQDKISDMIFDIVKYMITVELVAFLFSDIGNWRWYNFVLTIVAIIGLIALGFVFMNDSNDNKK